MKYCLDASSLITAYNADDGRYPMDMFPSLWEFLEKNKEVLIITTPIYQELNNFYKTETSDRKSKKIKNELVVWLNKNNFKIEKLSNEIKDIAIKLKKDYKIDASKKGVSSNDIDLIAYAKEKGFTVVTEEAEQTPKPELRKKYKIPLICKEEKVNCIKIIDLFKKLGLKI